MGGMLEVKAAQRILRDRRGFTIIETMAASVIIAIGFLGLAGVHALSSRAQSMGNNQGLATFVASEELERAHASDFNAIQSGGGSKTVEGVNFQIERTVAQVATAARVQVRVSWTDRLGPHSITLVSLVSQVTNPQVPSP